MRLNVYDVILEPVITEKIAKSSEKMGKYAFYVHTQSNKKEVRSAVEKHFNVHVTKVNIINEGGKWRRVRFQPGMTRDMKKAIVTLKKGEKIDITA